MSFTLDENLSAKLRQCTTQICPYPWAPQAQDADF